MMPQVIAPIDTKNTNIVYEACTEFGNQRVRVYRMYPVNNEERFLVETYSRNAKTRTVPFPDLAAHQAISYTLLALSFNFMKNPQTLSDYAVNIFIHKAKQYKNWEYFWADCMNYAKGNVSQIVLCL